MKNRYSGNCYGCGDFVGAGHGIYQNGEVFCSDPVSLEDVPDSLRSRFRLTVKRWATCWNRVNPILGTQFATIEELRDQERAEREASKPTAEQVAETKARMRALAAEERKQRRAELAEFQVKDICPRCHGAGGSDAWFATGWTCQRCHGSGKY